MGEKANYTGNGTPKQGRLWYVWAWRSCRVSSYLSRNRRQNPQGILLVQIRVTITAPSAFFRKASLRDWPLVVGIWKFGPQSRVT